MGLYKVSSESDWTNRWQKQVLGRGKKKLQICLIFKVSGFLQQQEIQDMQRNKHVWPIHRGEKGTIPGEVSVFNLLDRYFNYQRTKEKCENSVSLNRECQLRGRAIFENNRFCWVEKCVNWNEKFSRGHNSRFKQPEGGICKLEGKARHLSLSSRNRKIKNKEKKKPGLRDLRNAIRPTNINITGAPKGEKNRGKNNISILSENFSNLVSKINLHIQDMQYTYNAMNSK